MKWYISKYERVIRKVDRLYSYCSDSQKKNIIKDLYFHELINGGAIRAEEVGSRKYITIDKGNGKTYTYESKV